MTLDELYKAKGEAITWIEVWQARLNDFNKQIVDELNKGKTDKKNSPTEIP